MRARRAAWMGSIVVVLAGAVILTRCRPPDGSVNGVLSVVDAGSGDTVRISLSSSSGTLLFLTPRCLRCLRHLTEIIAAGRQLPGHLVVISLTLAEAAVLSRLGLGVDVYAAIRADDVDERGVSSFPTIVHIRGGRQRFVWRGLPSSTAVVLARILPFYRWNAPEYWNQPLLDDLSARTVPTPMAVYAHPPGRSF